MIIDGICENTNDNPDKVTCTAQNEKSSDAHAFPANKIISIYQLNFEIPISHVTSGF